jgi:hypothetical protein
VTYSRGLIVKRIGAKMNLNQLEVQLVRNQINTTSTVDIRSVYLLQARLSIAVQVKQT